MTAKALAGRRLWVAVGLATVSAFGVLGVLAVLSEPEPTPVRILDAAWVGPEQLGLTLDNCGNEDHYEPEVERTGDGFEVTVWYTSRIPSERHACADAVAVTLPAWDDERIIDGATGSSIVVTDRE